MEKNVERLMKKTKKELVEIILRKDEECNNLSNSLNDFVKRCDDLELRLKNAIEDCESSKQEIERLRSDSQSNESLVEKIQKLNGYLQEANKNVLEHQETIDSLTTDKEVIKNELFVASKKNKTLSGWCTILSIISIILIILLLAF